MFSSPRTVLSLKQSTEPTQVHFSLASPGYGPHGFVNVLAILFDRFHVQMRPDEAILFHPHDGYPGHVQPRGHPMPLAPHYTIGSRVPKQLCLEVWEALEHARPVLADLFFATEAPVRVGGLFAAVVRIEAPQKAFEVVAIERLCHPFDYHRHFNLPPSRWRIGWLLLHVSRMASTLARRTSRWAGSFCGLLRTP
jgi:hypothetical protein